MGAVLCYIALAVLIDQFIVKSRKSAMEAGLLGVCVYAVYETTSYAVLKHWNAWIALIDTVWGGVLFYLVTAAVYMIMRQYNEIWV